MSEGQETKKNPTNNLGEYAKKGGPGRPKGSIDRVRAVELAICKKAKLEGMDGVVEWLSGLEDKDLSHLYARLLPKESHVKVDVPWEDAVAELERVEKLLIERRRRIIEEAQRKP